MRFKHKSWQDKRPGWTRRVTWYEGETDAGVPDIRLCMADSERESNLYYDNREAAQIDYDRFANGMSIIDIGLLGDSLRSHIYGRKVQ